jgi:hypothetical protein
MKTYHGSCHCGAVSYEVDADLSKIGECSCSLCRKKGSLHHTVRPEQFRLLSGADNLRAYQFNKKIAKHFFCQTCGIHCYSNPRTAPDKINVNVRGLDDFDAQVEDYDLSRFDGRNWEEAFAARQKGR